MSLLHILLVALGSAIGGLARFGMVRLFALVAGESSIHWGTMIVNLSGSLFLGWISTLLFEIWDVEEAVRLNYYTFLGVGIAGGYTTFSTFELETYRLLRQGHSLSAILYVTGSVFVGLIAFRVGMLLAGGD